MPDQSRQIEVTHRPLMNLLSVISRTDIDPASLFHGLPRSYEDCKDRKMSVDWETFVILMERMEKAFGSSQRMVDLIAFNPHQIDGNQVIGNIGGFFASPTFQYRAVVKWLGPAGFPFARFAIEDLPGGRLQITIELPDSIRDCDTFYSCWLGGFIGTPSALGLKNADVEMIRTPHRAVYLITPPLSVTIIARIQRAFRALLGARSSLDELARQQEEIQRLFQKRMESERKTMETEMRLKLSEQSATLSKLSTLGQMASGIAHEINNPLAIISSRAQRLERRLVTDSTNKEEIIEEVKKISATALRIGAFTRDLLHFSGDGSKDPLAEVSISELVESTLSFCRVRYESYGIVIDDSGLTPGIVARLRHREISQVLMNLLSNAFDVLMEKNPPEKKIWIESGKIKNSWFLAVSDNAGKIPEDLKKEIFNPFFTTKAVGKGSGIGLSVSRGIVDGHGGRLTFENDEKRTRFQITIPL